MRHHAPTQKHAHQYVSESVVMVEWVGGGGGGASGEGVVLMLLNAPS